MDYKSCASGQSCSCLGSHCMLHLLFQTHLPNCLIIQLVYLIYFERFRSINSQGPASWCRVPAVCVGTHSSDRWCLCIPEHTHRCLRLESRRPRSCSCRVASSSGPSGPLHTHCHSGYLLAHTGKHLLVDFCTECMQKCNLSTDPPTPTSTYILTKSEPSKRLLEKNFLTLLVDLHGPQYVASKRTHTHTHTHRDTLSPKISAIESRKYVIFNQTMRWDWQPTPMPPQPIVWTLKQAFGEIKK